MTARPLPAPAPPAPAAEPARRRRFGALDGDVLARAEAALKALSVEFAGWTEEEVGRLEAAHARLNTEGATPDAWSALLTRTHDLKGLGATYGHPLVTRLCASLHRLLDAADRREAARRLVAAHVAAVRAAVDGAPETETQAACGRLEAQVAAVLGGG